MCNLPSNISNWLPFLFNLEIGTPRLVTLRKAFLFLFESYTFIYDAIDFTHVCFVSCKCEGGIGAFLDADVWPDIDPDPGALGDNKT